MKILIAILVLLPCVAGAATPPMPIQQTPWTTNRQGSPITNSSPIQSSAQISANVGGQLGFKTSGLISATNAINGPVNALGHAIVYSGATIQTALDWAKRNGQTEVVVPTGTYVLSTALKVWTGVSLKGYGWPTLLRNYHLIGDCGAGSYTGERFMVYLYGANTLQGFNINGNSTNFYVATAGVDDCINSPYMDSSGRVNQTQYGDVAISNGAYDYGPDGNTLLTGADNAWGQPGQYSVVVRDNRFFNSPGSSIKNFEAGARGVSVQRNAFYGYYDHAFYLRGWSNLLGTNVPIWNVDFSGNLVSCPSATRGNGAVKLANYTFNAVLNGNILYVPNDAAFEIDAGDAGFGSGNMEQIEIAGNSGQTLRFLMLAGDYPSPQFHVHCADNNFAVTDYVVGGPYSTFLAVAGDIDLIGCKFVSTDITKALLLLTRGDVAGGLDFTISGCEFKGAVSIQTFGWLRTLNVVQNRFYNLRTPSLLDAPSVIYNPTGNGMVVGINQWTIKGNITYNYARLIYEDSDLSTVGGTNILSTAIVRLSENTMFGNLTVNAPFGFDGSFNLTNTACNPVFLGPNQADSLTPGIPLEIVQAPIFPTPPTNTTATALILRSPGPFGTNGTAAAAIDFQRFTNRVARLSGGNERQDTSGYGELKGEVANDLGVMTERFQLGLLRARLGAMYQTNFTGGIGTSVSPWAYGGVWNIVHSDASAVALAWNLGGSATYWQLGGSAGAGMDSTTAPLWNSTYSAGHGSRPVIYWDTSGITHLDSGTIYAPAGQTLFLGPDNNSGAGTTTVSGNFTVNNSVSADLSVTGGDTRLLLWDVTGGSLKRVTVGTNDSAGVGFKYLKIAN